MKPLAAGADIAVILVIKDEIRSGECAIAVGRLIKYANMLLDAFFLDQPSEVCRIAIPGVRCHNHSMPFNTHQSSIRSTARLVGRRSAKMAHCFYSFIAANMVVSIRAESDGRQT